MHAGRCTARRLLSHVNELRIKAYKTEGPFLDLLLSTIELYRGRCPKCQRDARVAKND